MPIFDIFASPRWSPLRISTKVVSFFIFFQELSNKKKIKAPRPKMTKIASRGVLPQVHISQALFLRHMIPWGNAHKPHWWIDEWSLCEYVINHTILPPSPVIRGSSWVASQNGFHWFLDTMTHKRPILFRPRLVGVLEFEGICVRHAREVKN